MDIINDKSLFKEMKKINGFGIYEFYNSNETPLSFYHDENEAIFLYDSKHRGAKINHFTQRTKF